MTCCCPNFLSLLHFSVCDFCPVAILSPIRISNLTLYRPAPRRALRLIMNNGSGGQDLGIDRDKKGKQREGKATSFINSWNSFQCMCMCISSADKSSSRSKLFNGQLILEGMTSSSNSIPCCCLTHLAKSHAKESPDLLSCPSAFEQYPSCYLRALCILSFHLSHSLGKNALLMCSRNYSA